ncbi:MAG: SRPBCC family protein [Chromatiales bacterium]|nr:SRPBCC family protein [Chromatiales bacterium]
MTWILALLAAILAGGLIYLATREGNYTVARSLSMAVDQQAAFDKVRDLRTWHEWSPWLMHEPATSLEFSDNPDQEGGFYTWDGQMVGAGRLMHVTLDTPTRIEQKIEFTRPFKSVCRVWWEFSTQDSGETLVSWNMQGQMPFLMRFMTAMMVPMIEKDYTLGLAMLRGRLDPQAARPVIEFPGEAEFEATTALTIAFAGGMEQMVEAMESGFPKLKTQVEATDNTITAAPFTAYHRVDPKKGQFECDLAIPATETTEEGEFVRKTLGGGGRYFKVTLQGSYEFLELAWYSAMSHLRMKKLKLDTSRPSLEVYENDPASVDHSNEIRTALYLPIK